uniref:Dynein_C domain-containing protein n=1 Tax=Glossina brevipalpis TaxID=37001 RepID=A0A1A9WUJ7_9MUSC
MQPLLALCAMETVYMYLEGGGWIRKSQCRCDPSPKELVTAMPVIHSKSVEQLKKRTRGVYACPSYYYPQRAGSYIIAVDLKAGSEKAESGKKEYLYRLYMVTDIILRSFLMCRHI